MPQRCVNGVNASCFPVAGVLPGGRSPRCAEGTPVHEANLTTAPGTVCGVRLTLAVVSDPLMRVRHLVRDRAVHEAADTVVTATFGMRRADGLNVISSDDVSSGTG